MHYTSWVDGFGAWSPSPLLFCSVQSLSFYRVSFLRNDGNDSITKVPPTPPILHKLLVEQSDDICGAIARPEVTASLANVRKFERTMCSYDNSLIGMMPHDLEHIPNIISDIFDSKHYQSLRHKKVVVDGKE
ncbi:hypothetical protein DFH07DRAFT_780986 [Mycena maculata]|uniref:Uncharacterized protein n=1 Tax=Mycena maculata TaxID=230809 RepID=A0AAD7I0G4_9AGAR|nr:hypothetical protein DFH07DRAFT_780986 [Mycena maculata]